MKIALVPCNPTVGSWEENLKAHKSHAQAAFQAGANLAVFPELSLLGYPARDLLFRKSILAQARQTLKELQEWIAREFAENACVVGLPWQEGDKILNAAILVQAKELQVRAKSLIPRYDVFHELRYFHSALDLPDPLREKYIGPVLFAEKTIGILICEDSWHQMKLAGHALYSCSPALELKKKGAQILLNISASPFYQGKKSERRDLISQESKTLQLPIGYVNQIGAQDELVFDGDAFFYNSQGELSAENDQGESLACRIPLEKKKPARVINPMTDLRQALVWGIRDYAKKNGFQRFVLGLSGGIDSALVAVLAADAFGPTHVTGLMMPSKFSSTHSIDDAQALAVNLGISTRHLPIKMPHSTALMSLKDVFQGAPEDVTEENIQARLRGLFVMAFSNKYSALALATGNKSEFAMGYSTLYGDMCGGLAPIGDLYKTQVYELAKFINQGKEVIPVSTMEKAPSAELRANQKDQDTLPPYDLLDQILYQLIELDLSVKEATANLSQVPSSQPKLIEKIASVLHKTEYKRKQAPLILKVSPRSFGSGRVYPLTYRIN